MITKKIIFGYTPLKWYPKHFIRRMDRDFSDCFFFICSETFEIFLKEDVLILFLRVLFGNFDRIQEHFLTFWKDKILSIFFLFFSKPYLGWEFFLYWSFLSWAKFLKKKVYQYNWRQLTFPPLYNPPLFFKASKIFLCVSPKKLEKKIVTSSFFIFPKIVRRGDQGIVVFNYTDCLKENFPFLFLLKTDKKSLIFVV